MCYKRYLKRLVTSLSITRTVQASSKACNQLPPHNVLLLDSDMKFTSEVEHVIWLSWCLQRRRLRTDRLSRRRAAQSSAVAVNRLFWLATMLRIDCTRKMSGFHSGKNFIDKWSFVWTLWLTPLTMFILSYAISRKGFSSCPWAWGHQDSFHQPETCCFLIKTEELLEVSSGFDRLWTYWWSKKSSITVTE